MPKKYEYKYRHQEKYKDQKIDVKANRKSDLISKVADAKRKIDEGLIKETDMTLRSWVDLWLETYKRPSVSNSWYIQLERRTRPLLEDLGHKKIASIKTGDLRRYLNRYAGQSEKYIKTNYTMVREIFRTAQLDQKINKDPAIGLTMPKGKEERRRRSMTPNEITAFLQATEGNDIELLTKFMYYCGLRPGEALALTWDDVDLDSRIVTVHKAYKKDGTIGAPKTAAGNRKVPIPKDFASQLKKPATAKGRRVTDVGSMKTVDRRWADIRQHMHELDPSIDQSEIELYMLRHTYCTNLEKAGVPINIAKALMGHSSIQMTAKIYTHFDDQTLEIARSMIDN